MEAEMEQGKMFFHIGNSLILNKGLMYVNMTPKGETEGVLAFVIPKGSIDGDDTLSSASRVPLGWVGGVLWLLPLAAPRLAMWRGIGAGDGVGSRCDEEVH